MLRVEELHVILCLRLQSSTNMDTCCILAPVYGSTICYEAVLARGVLPLIFEFVGRRTGTDLEKQFVGLRLNKSFYVLFDMFAVLEHMIYFDWWHFPLHRFCVDLFNAAVVRVGRCSRADPPAIGDAELFFPL